MKKTIAYVLIAVVAVGAIYYLYNKKGDVLNTGSAKTPFETDDNAAYKQMRALISADDLAWVDVHVKERFSTTPDLINGQKSKAATFLRTISAVAPNAGGKYPPAPWSGTTPLIWPDATIAQMWTIQNSLTAKYNNI